MYQNGRTLFSLGSGMWLLEQQGLGPEWWLSALTSLPRNRPTLLHSELLSGPLWAVCQDSTAGGGLPPKPMTAHETYLVDNPATIAPMVQLTPTILSSLASMGRLVWPCEKQWWILKRTPKSQA